MFDKTNNIIQSENIDNMVYDGIGFDGIRYIQQTGQKVQGKIYLDKTQPGLWYCLKTTSAINNTSDFTRADSTALLDKLQNLTPKSVILNVIRWTQTLIGPDNIYEYIAIIEQPPCSFDKVIGVVCIDGPYGTETLQYVYEQNLWRYIFRSSLSLDCTNLTMWKCAKIIYLD